MIASLCVCVFHEMKYLFSFLRGGWRRWKHGSGHRTSIRRVRGAGRSRVSWDWARRRRGRRNGGERRRVGLGSPCWRSSLWLIHPSASPRKASPPRRRHATGTSSSCARCCCSESTAESCRFSAAWPGPRGERERERQQQQRDDIWYIYRKWKRN